jgi:LuxR family maltose regulon positive regulatory protein
MKGTRNTIALEAVAREIPLNNLYVRPRINELFRKARTAAFVNVIANSGYGKTIAVYQYLRQQDVPFIWLRFIEADNNIDHFWESYARSVKTYAPGYGERLRMLGFPDSDEKFDIYLRIQNEELERTPHLIVVHDDMHFISDAEILRFMEKSAARSTANIKRILVSRTEPRMDCVDLFVKGRIARIAEEDLIFTRGEIGGYLKALGMNVQAGSVDRIAEETGGWAFAVNLTARLLERSGGEMHEARYAYRENIQQLIDSMVRNDISDGLFRLMLKMSLINRKHEDLVRQIAGSDELMQELNDMTSFVRFDGLLRIYEIHLMFLAYLKERQDALTGEEKAEIHRLAGAWYEASGQEITAATYYTKCGDWEKVVAIAKGMPMEIPIATAETFLALLAECPQERLSAIPDYYPLRIRLLMCIGDFARAREECREMIETFSALPEEEVVPCLIGHLYFLLGTIEMLHAENAEHFVFGEYFEKAGERLRGKQLCSTGLQNVWHLGAHTLLVGTSRPGAMEEFLDQTEIINRYSDAEFHGRTSGLYELVLGEYYFYKGDMERTLDLYRAAYRRSTAFDQSLIQNRAIIGRIFVATALGDYEEIKRAKADLDLQYEKRDSLYRVAAYDVAYAEWAYAVGHPEDCADWLKGRFTSDYKETDTVLFESFLHYSKAKILLHNMQYDEVLHFIGQEHVLRRCLLSRIGLTVMEAISRYRLGDLEAAYDCLADAHDLAESNEFYMHFTRYGKDMQSLIRSALNAGYEGVPKEWLETIYKRASIGVKRRKSIIDAYAADTRSAAPTKITLQEKKLLQAIDIGLSKNEMAEELGVSPNTIRGMTDRVVGKLAAQSKTDAARVAREMNII